MTNRRPMTSAIFGEGHGSTHDWQRVAQGDGYTGYSCRSCEQRFVHSYLNTSNIFEAIEKVGIPDICKGVAS